MEQKKQYNIRVVGNANSGKTTFVNSVARYTYKIPERMRDHVEPSFIIGNVRLNVTLCTKEVNGANADGIVYVLDTTSEARSAIAQVDRFVKGVKELKLPMVICLSKIDCRDSQCLKIVESKAFADARRDVPVFTASGTACNMNSEHAMKGLIAQIQKKEACHGSNDSMV